MEIPIKILVVDDEQLLRLGAVRLLQQAGYDVLEAATGAEGLRLTRDAHPDLLLLDVMLPDLSGIEVCRQIKADPALSKTYVVLLSGVKISSDDQADGLEGGADDYIERPIANRELLARLKAIVRIKTAEKALYLSEQYYRNVFNAMSDAMLVADDDARYVDVNPAACDLFGYSREEFLQLSVWDIAPIPNRDQGAALWQAFIAAGTQQGEYSITRKDGQERVLDYRAVANIAPGRHVSVLRDITERKQAEDILKQYQQIVSSTPDGIALVDRAYRYRLVNNAYETFSGVKPERLLGLTVAEYLGDDVFQRYVKPHFDRCLQGETIEYHEWFDYPTLGRRFVHVTYFPYCDAQQNIVGIVANTRDVTGIKRAAEALRQSEQRYRQLIESLQEGIWVIDEQACTTFVNPRMAELLGYTVAEMQGQPLFTFMDERGIAVCQSNLERRQQGIKEQHDFEFLRKDGARMYATLETSPMTDGEGNYIGAIAGVMDITARKQAEAELQQHREHLEELILARTRELQDANRQLAREIAARQQIEDALHHAKDAAETANRAKSRFLANMSHELRSPLNVILGFSQLLERDPDTTARQREHLELIRRSGAHLLELINDVLELSKIEAGQSEVTITTVDLRQTLSDLETLLHVRADRKHLRLVFAIAADVPRQIRIDQRKLRQVLINLLENAVKFTVAGQVALRVTCAPPEPQAGRVTLRFEVADTGVGIAAAELPKLFTAFTQTASGQQQAEGTGLGLALSRQFAQLLGGDITVASQPGQGTTFTFSLPAQLAGTSEQPSPRPKRRVIGLAPAQPAYRILVVEDDPASQSHLCTLLQELGFRVQAADDGAQAITVYNDWQPHLILMDMRMPIMDGYAATQEIRKLETGNSEKFERANPERPASTFQFRIPIIAVTASAFEEERAAILAAGCDVFIRKPFWGDEIPEVIQQQLGVQYRYAEPEDPRAGGPSCAAEGIRDAQQLSERMAALAPDVLANLERAAFESDIEAVDSLLVHIRENDAPLADVLTGLSRNFNYDEIVRMIQETRHKHGDGL